MTGRLWRTRNASGRYCVSCPIQNRTERAELMKAVDRLNHKYGLKTVKLGVEGRDDQAWKVKCEQRTPNYLTDIDELMVVRI